VKLQSPPRVQQGQTIGICAPAGPVNAERLQRGLARLGKTFELRVADNILSERSPNVPSYLAASDAARAAELNAMLADPDVRGIVLARGGYGLMRILDELDGGALVKDPKPIVGFSDATALLLATIELMLRWLETLPLPQRTGAHATPELKREPTEREVSHVR
jgi:muramoyltetrapeptide carboxypeptidase